jgi:hypothetical protein
MYWQFLESLRSRWFAPLQVVDAIIQRRQLALERVLENAPSHISGRCLQWRQRARAMVGVPTAMREREWRNSFILGKTPDQAAEAAQRWAYNAGVAFARMNGGRKPR